MRAAAERDLQLTVRFVGAREGRALNRRFRQRDYPTNVLTFISPAIESARGSKGKSVPLAGDIVLCAPVVMREARAQGKALAAHYAHLVVHGVLHLQGYDHDQPRDAERMETRERTILQELGYADPY